MQIDNWIKAFFPPPSVTTVTVILCYIFTNKLSLHLCYQMGINQATFNSICYPFFFCYLVHPPLFLSLNCFHHMFYLGLFSDSCWPFTISELSQALLFLLTFVHFCVCFQATLLISIFFLCLNHNQHYTFINTYFMF